jgi:hypothetical protein
MEVEATASVVATGSTAANSVAIIRGGFGAFGGPLYEDYDDQAGCWWSKRYHRRFC